MATILAVDDHVVNREFLVTLLSYRDHRVLQAADGAEALVLMRQERPDLVISDILMPTMDGYEFVRQLRLDSGLADIPVIFYTAHYPERDATSLAEACGVAHVLIKPCEPEFILRMVEETLRRSDRPAFIATAPQDFNREHLRLITNKLSRLTGELQWTTSRLSTLIEISLQLASERDPGRLLDGFCHAARDLIGAGYAVAGLREQGTVRPHRIFVSGVYGESAAEIEGLLLKEGAFPSIFAGFQSIGYRNPSGEPGKVGLPAAHPPVLSLLVASVRSPTRTYGWLYLAEKQGTDGFTEEDERLLATLASLVGRIYENSRLNSELRDRAGALEAEITAREAVQWRLEAQYAVASILAETSSLEEAAPMVLRAICERMGFAYGELFEVDRTADLLRFLDAWHVSGKPMESFAAIARRNTFAPGVGMAGRVWAGGQPIWIPDITRDGNVLNVPDAVKVGLHAALGFPVFARGEVIGVLSFLSNDVRSPNSDTIDMFKALGSQLGQFVERLDQRKKIARLARIHAVLSGINALIVRVGDREELFREACRIAVEQGGFLTAWIGLVRPDPSLPDPSLPDPSLVDPSPTASEGGDPRRGGGIPTGYSLAEIEQELGPQTADAIRERRPVFNNSRNASEPGPGLGVGRQVPGDCRSSVALPLTVDGAVIGVFAMFAAEADFFTAEELKLLTELAGDISFALDHIEKAERLAYLTYHDPLTGLPNRELFHERLSQALHLAARNGSQVVVVVGDLRRFHTINETLGRHAGDDLLMQLADRIRRAARTADNTARLAGDRFASFLPDIDNATEIAHDIGESLDGLVGKPFRVDGQELTMALASGVAIYPIDGGDAETLLKNAEAALKQAKASGQNYVFYEPALNARVAETLRLEHQMRQALHADQFVLHYQPKIDLQSGEVSGVEALLRWEDPESGLVLPSVFIPLLEETGLIVEAGLWAIRTALADQYRWRAAGRRAVRVAVNVSPVQLQRANFTAKVKALIEDFRRANGGIGCALDLEITESVIMRNIEDHVPKLTTLKEMGVEIVIDDFGTGYSSLGYLAKLPLTALKIDRSFIVRMTTSSEDMTIVSTIISLAHALGLKVVAEGVETEEQVKILRLLNCEEMQGYLTSRPVPYSALLAMLPPERRSGLASRPARVRAARPR